MSHHQWNRLASSFEDDVCDITAVSGDRLAELVHRAQPNEDQVLIDAGCGIGSFIKRFGRRFGEVIAFDFAPQMVARAKERCPGLERIRWSTLGLENAAARYGTVGDLVVCLNVITSTDESLRDRQWSSLAGLVKPGGQLLAVVPSIESARHVLQHIDEDNEIHGSKPDESLIFRGDEHQKHYAREELRQILWCRGLRVLSLKRIHYPWSDEGIETEPTAKPPWDWVCLARKAQRARRSSTDEPSEN